MVIGWRPASEVERMKFLNDFIACFSLAAQVPSSDVKVCIRLTGTSRVSHDGHHRHLQPNGCMTTEQSEAFLSFLEDALPQLKDMSGSLLHDKHSEVHHTIIGLYGSILEYTADLLCLLEQKRGTSIPVLLRASIEAYVDLTNLVADEHYMECLEAAYLKEWTRLLTHAAAGNPYLKNLRAADFFETMRERWGARAVELREQGVRAKQWSEKFEAAGMRGEYEAIYNDLCSSSHNNLRAILSRHVEIVSDETDFNIVLFRSYEIEDFLREMVYIVSYMMKASFLVHEYFKSESLEELHRLQARLNLLPG